MIYTCSPCAGNIENNTALTGQACGYAIRQGVVSLALRLLYPQVLNDSVPEERGIGVCLGLDILEQCKELQMCGGRMSAGMKWETVYAKARGIPVCRIPAYEIMRDQMVQELGKGTREGLETSQSYRRNVQLGM